METKTQNISTFSDYVTAFKAWMASGSYLHHPQLLEMQLALLCLSYIHHGDFSNHSHNNIKGYGSIHREDQLKDQMLNWCSSATEKCFHSLKSSCSESQLLEINHHELADRLIFKLIANIKQNYLHSKEPIIVEFQSNTH